jgi:chromosome segregation ATPase
MAKKKTGLTGKATNAKNESKPAKPAKKKAIAKKAGSKPAPAKATKKTRSRGRSKAAQPKSIDGILKGFEKERVSLKSSLVSTQKGIDQTIKQLASLKSKLTQLQKQEADTEIAIETLDARRDKEIGSMLNSIGINLESAAAAVKKETAADLGTPLFPEDPVDTEDAKATSAE